ncbi:MAG TPA: hypothetical protein PKZ38_07150, partial [Dermatophilaceae bacterium]|nr:hypothetical protein [Dermatophilaceae bacterium]
PAPSGASRTSLASTPSGVESSTGIPSPSSSTTDAQAALQAEAVEAVKRYYAAWNRAVISRSSAELRALSLPQCEPCQRDIAAIDDLKRQNQTARGGMITLSGLRASPGVDAGILVQGELVRAPVDLIGTSGKVVKSYPEDRTGTIGWILARSGGVLKIKDIA